ncbi:hypothetical protein BBI01_01125 [Chryseobacterium artocarpi]|uniref:HTH araC/xylS-type domain-containing protein n=1 Tax=Chryseobacterium artocarpi TaxID=1414727 RepID=A0A1B8ZZY0_9FLAO|nr:helix-turn-helix transcriptional regulator [Chryseobacterium artocarpi]OCA77094.1 hypothetical protein BBI01_01125 [Chryseobacterium artocarpi]
MNLYVISYLDALVGSNIALFCKMNFVRSAVYLSELNQLSVQLKSVADFYFRFLQQINFLSIGVFVVDYVFNTDSADVNDSDMRVIKALNFVNEQYPIGNDVTPIHLRYADNDEMHLIAGVVKMENKKIVFMHLVDLHIPKNSIKTMSKDISYVKEILESYDPDNKQSLRDLVARKGFSYNQFQKDCKVYFGDTFYSFLLKRKIMDAVVDIIFTRMSFKEIAFKNKFIDYPNMYKTFLKYGVTLPMIPRIAY